MLRLTLALLCVALCGVAMAGNPGYRIIEDLEILDVPVPVEPTNPYLGVSYMCFVWSAERFNTYANAHVTGIKNFNNDSYAHHGWLAVFPKDSVYFQDGNILSNPEDGKIYPDCLGVASGFQTLYPEQADLRDFNAFAVDGDASPANGYKYGLSVGKSNTDGWIVANIHMHNHDATPNLFTDIRYKVQLTTVSPEERLGWINTGLGSFYEPLPINSDGTHDISIVTPNSVRDLSLTTNPADYSLCEDYCYDPSSQVNYDNIFETRLENSGVSQMKAIGGYVHAHKGQVRVSFEIIRANGDVEVLYECDSCGATTGTDAWRWFSAPVAFGVGDSTRTNCSFVNTDHHGNVITDPIEFGLGAAQQMCSAFVLVSYTEEAIVEPLWAPLGGWCESRQNAGYANEALIVPPSSAALCALPSCAGDLGCIIDRLP